MKTKNIIKYVAILMIVFSSCVEDGDFEIPTLGDDKEYANLKSLSEIATLYQSGIVDFEEEITTYGYVISDDRDGNFFGAITIQDKPEKPTIGFQVRISGNNLSARYNVGRKIYIKLKGLALSKYHETFQIGVRNGYIVDRMSEHEYVKFIDRSSEVATLIPTELKINEITDDHVNMLIKINNLQSEIKGLTFANPTNNDNINRNLISCDSFDKIILRTSGYSTFKSVPIPDKKGSITAVLGKFENDYQLLIRNTDDVDLTQEYGCYNNPTQTSLAEVKNLFSGSETRITESLKIKVVVTSSLIKGNISNKNAFVQDASAAIALNFSDTYNLNLGDEIEIAVGGLLLSKYNGLLRLNLATSNILSTTSGTLPTPEIITFTQALTGDYESKLVKINDVQFKDIAKTYAGNNVLTSDCTDALKLVSVKTDAAFANNQVSDKKGTITGILTQSNGVELYIRDENDVDFTATYDCVPSGTSNDLFFSEYVEGSSSNKYIEIYNATGADVDLSTYSLELYGNGSPTATRNLDLSSLATTTLANNEVLVLYNSRADTAIINEGDYSSSIPFFNGDDAVALLKNGTVIDVVGKIGEDPGAGWEVAGETDATKDHTLIRKSTIITGNTDWAISAGTDASNSEWEVKAKDDFSSVGKR